MTEEKKKETPKKKTLSLGKTISVEEIDRSSAKKVRGRVVSVEVVGRKKKEPIPKVSEENITEQQSKLSEEDILKKKKILERANSDKPEEVNVASTIRVVVKESVIPTAEAMSDININPKENQNTLGSKVVNTIRTVVYGKDHNKTQGSTDVDEESESAAKPKKATTNEKKKFNKADILNIYVRSIDDEVEEEEEEILETPEEVQPTSIRYTPVLKRKNKRRDANYIKDKISRVLEFTEPLTAEELANKLAEKTKTILNETKKLGMELNSSSLLDMETTEIITTELGHKFVNSTKESTESKYLNWQGSPENLKKRPPVITIMGHVDHGKTTVLDTIRKSAVAAKEAGGITQHIGAYQVEVEGQLITFLDTPGHEAFSQIRARGSQITDIVVLVVAADDGIKPQTVEAINHAKAAGVPIIVAINKIDKQEKNPQKVKADLLQYDLVVEEMGGDVLCVEISAKSNIGIDKLLETIILQAEIMELKADPTLPVKGSVIEVKTEKGFGALVTILVQRGTLKLGDYFVCGTKTGKVKVMINDKGQRIKEALPSTPVEISGFNDIVSAGDIFLSTPNESVANDIANERLEKVKQEEIAGTESVFDLFAKDTSNVKTLNLIVKGDTQGSIEAIIGSLDKIKHDEVQIKILHKGVGEINESDIALAKTASAVIIGFNVRANNKAKISSEKEKIELRYHSIIYNLIDDVKLMLSGLLDASIVENIIGYAEVREVFNISKVGTIAGCFVTEGVLRRSAYVRLLRDNVVIHEGVLAQLKRFKEDVKEVKTNFECGAAFENYNNIQVGDFIECYEKVEVKNTLE